MLHTTPITPTIVGDDVVIGHLAHLECCTVHDGALIGTGSIVLHRAVIEAGALVGAGAVVPNGMVVPSGAMALGRAGEAPPRRGRRRRHAPQRGPVRAQRRALPARAAPDRLTPHPRARPLAPYLSPSRTRTSRRPCRRGRGSRRRRAARSSCRRRWSTCRPTARRTVAGDDDVFTVEVRVGRRGEELLPRRADLRLTFVALAVRRRRVLEHAVVGHRRHHRVDVVTVERLVEAIDRCRPCPSSEPPGIVGIARLGVARRRVAAS